jgi:2'-5' RNA ligase
MGFEFDSYVVLDVPPPMSDRVMAIRRKHRDDFRMALPIEITVAGSSGVGVIEKDQDPDAVFDLLRTIAEHTSPVIAEFGGVLRFDGTDIFVLTLADEGPFHRLHKEIAESGIRFAPSPFPYKPHCTLRSLSPISKSDVADLMATRLDGEFILRTLSVFAMSGLPMERLVSIELGNRDAG